MNDLAWRLADIPKPTGPTVLSCFHCGGGSSMGYKLAGCDVVGGVEIDARMMQLYRQNMHPRWSFIGDIRTAPVPNFHVDILDGSPPCTSFSSMGQREKSWGKEKVFQEGGTKQRLDDLFFAFIDYAEKVRPTVVIAENVIGLIAGNARAYTRRIKEGFERIGYTLQAFQLSAAHFGVPQLRRRIFFIAHKSKRTVKIEPTQTSVTTIRKAFEGINAKGRRLSSEHARLWDRAPPGRQIFRRTLSFNWIKVNPDSVAPALTASGSMFAHWEEPVEITAAAYARIQSFPDDYNFTGANPVYVCGMSVAPLVMRSIAQQVREQLF